MGVGMRFRASRGEQNLSKFELALFSLYFLFLSLVSADRVSRHQLRWRRKLAARLSSLQLACGKYLVQKNFLEANQTFSDSAIFSGSTASLNCVSNPVVTLEAMSFTIKFHRGTGFD